MNRPFARRHFLTAASLILGALASAQTYFPPSGQWRKKPPAEVGMDAAKLSQAIEYAQSNGSDWDFDRDQVRVFGAPLGPLPKTRAATNGIVLRHGYIVAEFGDTKANDPVYSVAKSFLSTVCSLAVERGLIKDVNDRVADYIHDGGYDSPHNAKIAWKHHLQQTSEWEGTMWGKNADFVGVEQFGNGKRAPRAIQEPGSFYEYNDVRINRFSLSLLRLFGKGLPEVLKSGIMDPIGASQDWRWIPYDNSAIDIGGKQIGSVSGGTRWGGGIVDQLGRPGALRPADSEPRPMGRSSAGLREVVEGCSHAQRARPRLRLPLVAEYETEAVAERARGRASPLWETARTQSGSTPSTTSCSCGTGIRVAPWMAWCSGSWLPPNDSECPKIGWTA